MRMIPLDQYDIFQIVCILRFFFTQHQQHSWLILHRTAIRFLRGLWAFHWASFLSSRKISKGIPQLRSIVHLPTLKLLLLSHKHEQLHHLILFQLLNLKFACMTNTITLCAAELLHWFFPSHLQENFLSRPKRSCERAQMELPWVQIKVVVWVAGKVH